MKVKYLKVLHGERANIARFPNFHKTGSIKGMKQKFYGKNALLVQCGDYIYNVDTEFYFRVNDNGTFNLFGTAEENKIAKNREQLGLPEQFVLQEIDSIIENVEAEEITEKQKHDIMTKFLDDDYIWQQINDYLLELINNVVEEE